MTSPLGKGAQQQHYFSLCPMWPSGVKRSLSVCLSIQLSCYLLLNHWDNIIKLATWILHMVSVCESNIILLSVRHTTSNLSTEHGDFTVVCHQLHNLVVFSVCSLLSKVILFIIYLSLPELRDYLHWISKEMMGEEEFQLHVAPPTYATHPMSLYKTRDKLSRLSLLVPSMVFFSAGAQWGLLSFLVHNSVFLVCINFKFCHGNQPKWLLVLWPVAILVGCRGKI